MNPTQQSNGASAYAGVTYKRPPRPLHFRESAKVPESRRHLEMRTFLYLVLQRAFGARGAIGSEQFVYFRADDPKKCLAPDAFVRLGATNEHFATWKTWERGAPDVAVEVASEFNRRWKQTLADYAEAGVRELVWFDQDANPGSRLRVWDRHEGDFVERVIEEDRTPSLVLGGTWFVAPSPVDPVSLRLLDAEGQLLLSPEEQALARVAELERELALARK